MQNILLPNFDLKKNKCIALDLDGTIYDEFDFIYQVYNEIVSYLVKRNKKVEVFNFLLKRWLQKGSSYPKIFFEAQEFYKLEDNFVNSALNIYKNFYPNLILSNRAKFHLDMLRKNTQLMFLITDGNDILQRNKIQSLKVKEYFDEIFITREFAKPNAYYGNIILNKYKLKPHKVLYYGDRKMDKEFAQNCGFNFSFCKIWESEKKTWI